VSYEVAVPSFRRADVLAKATLATLARGGVSPGRVTVFVGSQAEADDYSDCLDPASYAGMVVTGAEGDIAGQRNAIVRHYPAGTRLLCADDDLRAVEQLDGAGRLQEVTDLHALIEDGFAAAAASGAWLWGGYAARNAMFMRGRPAVTSGLCYIIGALHGTTLRHIGCELIGGVPYVEDFQRCLRYWSHDGAICRLNHVTLRTSYFARGGLQAAGRTPQLFAAQLRVLQGEFPGLVHVHRGRRSPYPEVQLRAPGAEVI